MISRRLSTHFLTSLKSVRSTLNKVNQHQCRREMQLAANKTFVNGQWIAAANNKQLNVLNPVNGQSVGCVPDMDATDTQRAIEAANKAFHSPAWNALTAKDRSILLKVYTYRILCSYINIIDLFHENVFSF